MAYTAAVLDSQIDVSDIRDLLVQGDTAFPTINFTLPEGFTGLTWRVRGTFMQFNLATQSEELAVTGSTTISVAWPVGSNFTTYYGEMQIVLVGTDALGNIVTKATGYVNVQRDFSISTVEVVDENLFEQLMAELSSSSVMLDQTTEQEIINGVPKLAADRVISDDHHIVDKKHVADAVAAVTADDFNHNDTANKQGGSAGEYYHTTQAQNAALHAHSNKSALDAVSGTNTGDQDVSGAISTHNTATGAHTILARKTETMQLLISRTIGAGENVSAITWTQDDAGNALALIDADVVFHVPTNTLSVGAIGNIGARINGYAGATDYQRTNVRQPFLLANQFRSNYGIGVLKIRKTGGYAHAVMDYSAFDGTTPSSSSYQQNTIFTVATITNLYLYMISGLPFFPEGTIIEIYGRTA